MSEQLPRLLTLGSVPSPPLHTIDIMDLNDLIRQIRNTERESIRVSLLSIDRLSSFIPYLPKSTGDDMRVVHQRSQDILNDYETTKKSGLVRLLKCYQRTLKIA